MRDLTNLDLMRSFAVLLVVCSHALFYTGNIQQTHYSFWFIGLLGVFLFFTHTTLVLMWSLDRDPHPLRFYIRRAFRIYPLWLVVLFLSVLVRLPTSPEYAPQFRFFHARPTELLANATLTFNFMHSGARIIGASWSLPIEVQMYVVLPFLYFFMQSYRRIWPLLLLDVLAMFTARAIDAPTTLTLISCTPLFLPGAMAYLGYKRSRPAHLPAWTFPFWILFLTAAFNTWGAHFHNSARSGWIFALLVGLTLPLFRQLTWPPLTRAAHLVAKYSYGVYLCHFAAIAIGVHYLEGHSFAARAAAFLVTIVVLPIVFYHLVEKPMIGYGSLLAKRFETGPEPPVNERMLSLEPAP